MKVVMETEIDPVLSEIDRFEQKIRRLDPITKKAMLVHAFPEYFIFEDHEVKKRIEELFDHEDKKSAV